MEFLRNIFNDYIFEKFSRMKRWWPEGLQLLVTTCIYNQTHLVRSYKWNKLFDRCRQLWLFPKQILCQKYFMFQNIFTNWICICNFFQVFFWQKCFTFGSNNWNAGKNCSWTITKCHYKVLWGCRTCVGRFKTEVTTGCVGCFEVIRNTRQPNTRLQSG